MSVNQSTWEVTMKIIGKVKWFNEQKKYGFIQANNNEYYVSYNGKLKEGQQVEFNVEQGEKGPKAMGVKILSEMQERTQQNQQM